MNLWQNFNIILFWVYFLKLINNYNKTVQLNKYKIILTKYSNIIILILLYVVV